MNISSELEPELDNEENRQERLEMLADAAVVCRPRLFAIHGLYHSDSDDVLGWGMEFADDDRTIFTDPIDGSVHHSNTAERVLQVLSRIADVRLTWLDPE